MNASHGSGPSDSRRKRWGYPVSFFIYTGHEDMSEDGVEYTTRRRILYINGRITLHNMLVDVKTSGYWKPQNVVRCHSEI